VSLARAAARVGAALIVCAGLGDRASASPISIYHQEFLARGFSGGYPILFAVSPAPPCTRPASVELHRLNHGGYLAIALIPEPLMNCYNARIQVAER